MHSELTCPACKQPLLKTVTVKATTLWCGRGPCPSDVANEGADGDSETEAYKTLCDLIDIEAEERGEDQ